LGSLTLPARCGIFHLRLNRNFILNPESRSHQHQSVCKRKVALGAERPSQRVCGELLILPESTIRRILVLAQEIESAQ